MKRALIGICGVLVVMTLALIAWRGYLAHVINNQLAEIQRAGLPANGEELNRWYAEVPDDGNATLLMAQAFHLRRDFSDSRDNLIHDFKLPGRYLLLPPEQVGLLRAYVDMNGPMLAKVDEALQRPASRYPADFTKLMNTELPHLAWLNKVAKVYEFRALVAAQAGETESIARDIESILGLARTLDDEPCILSQLVRLKLINSAFTLLQYRANAGTFNSAEVSGLTAAFTRTCASNVCAFALTGERAMMIPYFRMTRKEAMRIHPPRGNDDMQRDSPLPYNGPGILKLIGYYELDYGSYLIGMNKAIALASDPPPENLCADRYLAYIGEASTKRHRTFSGLLLSSYAGIVSRENDSTARQRLALAALAVEDFKNRTGHFPEKLADLLPGFLGKKPEDPFTGRDLCYRRTEHGYVIYSVGPDLQDDDGLDETKKRDSADKKSYDITFTVER